MGRGGSGVTPRGDSLRISFTFRGVNCRETLKIKPTKANIKFAEGMKSEIDRRIQLGTFDYREYFPNSKRADALCPRSSVITVSKAIDRYLESKRRTLAASTYESYESAVRVHIKPMLSDLRLSDLTTSAIRHFISQLEVGPKRINNILIPLRGMVDDAYSDNVIDSNPMDRITNLKVVTREPTPFNSDEQTAIIEAAEPAIANLIQFDFWTGLRIGELIALQWNDIDWIHGTAFIHRNNVRGNIKETKTVAGTRTIKLLPDAMGALKAQKAISFLADKEIFIDPRSGNGFPDDMTLRYRFWRHILKKSGVRYREPKQMRHTYASMMLTAGENPAWVARQMGHTNMTTTIKKYARWLPEGDDGGGGRASALFGKKRDDIGHKSPTKKGSR